MHGFSELEKKKAIEIEMGIETGERRLETGYTFWERILMYAVVHIPLPAQSFILDSTDKLYKYNSMDSDF